MGLAEAKSPALSTDISSHVCNSRVFGNAVRAELVEA